MSDTILSLVNKELERLATARANIDADITGLERERDKLVRLEKGIKTPVKDLKPKAAARKSGGQTVKEQILAYMRERGEPARIAQIVEATGAKNTTVNGTLHQLKKAGEVMLTGEGWRIIVIGGQSVQNGAVEAHA